MGPGALARSALAALLLALAFAGAARAEPVTVMTFNVWYGGVQVDSSSIGRAIRAADADIVGVQEPEGQLRRIARSAGLPYYLGARPHGRASFAPGDLYSKLTPGRYVAALFLDDGYSVLARTSFTVR